MVNYTLRQLDAFLAVAQTGSISAAGTQLHVSPSAVAAALTDLERALKTQLCIRRRSHGVTLTPTGRFLARRADDLVKGAEELELSVADAGEQLRGPLEVGCYSTLAPSVLPGLLEGFSQLHPQVTLDFLEGSQDELQEQLLSGRLDMAVVYDMDLHAGLRWAPLYSTQAYVLLPADHRLAAEPAVRLTDLADDPLILLEAPPSSHHTMTLFDRAGVSPRIRHRTTHFELTRSLVGRGLGYTVLVQRPRTDLTYEGQRVVAREITPAVKSVGVRLVWPASTRLSERAEALVAFAQETVGAGQPA